MKEVNELRKEGRKAAKNVKEGRKVAKEVKEVKPKKERKDGKKEERKAAVICEDRERRLEGNDTGGNPSCLPSFLLIFVRSFRPSFTPPSLPSLSYSFVRSFLPIEEQGPEG